MAPHIGSIASCPVEIRKVKWCSSNGLYVRTYDLYPAQRPDLQAWRTDALAFITELLEKRPGELLPWNWHPPPHHTLFERTHTHKSYNASFAQHADTYHPIREKGLEKAKFFMREHIDGSVQYLRAAIEKKQIVAV